MSTYLTEYPFLAEALDDLVDEYGLEVLVAAVNELIEEDEEGT